MKRNRPRLREVDGDWSCELRRTKLCPLVNETREPPDNKLQLCKESKICKKLQTNKKKKTLFCFKQTENQWELWIPVGEVLDGPCSTTVDFEE